MPLQRLRFSAVIRKLFVFLLLCCLVLTGCRQDSGQPGKDRGQKGSTVPGLQVRTVAVQRIALQRQVDLSGTLVSNEQVKVSSEIAGTVLESNIRLGQEVEAGQILFQLDTRELAFERERAESALRQTEVQLGIDPSRPTGAPDDEISSVRTAAANRDEARQKHAEAQELDKKGLIPRSDLETTRTRLRVAEAALQMAVENVRSLKASLQDRRAAVQLAQKKVNDASIRAPVSGAISERLAQRGEFVRENAQVATIVQLNPLQLNTAVQERLADVIRVNLPVQFAVEPFPGKTFRGRIANISPQIDPATRTFQVEVFVENPNRELKPGLFAQGVILTRTDQDVMAAPRAAVFTLAGVSSVFVIENGIARQQTVTLGAQEGDLAEIVSGLKGSEVLAASHLSQIVTGAKIAGNLDESAGGRTEAASRQGGSR